MEVKDYASAGTLDNIKQYTTILKVDILGLAGPMVGLRRYCNSGSQSDIHRKSFCITDILLNH